MIAMAALSAIYGEKGRTTMKRTFETMCGTSPRIHELTTEKPLYKYCAERMPDGIIASGFLGVGVWLVDGYGDECIAAFGGPGDRWDHAARHAINYTSGGRPYIRKGGSRWYLDEAIRTDR